MDTASEATGSIRSRDHPAVAVPAQAPEENAATEAGANFGTVDSDLERRILAIIDEWWTRGHPLTVASNMRKSGRFCVSVLRRELGDAKLHEADIERIVQELVDAGRLITDQFDSKDKRKGYRVVEPSEVDPLS